MIRDRVLFRRLSEDLFADESRLILKPEIARRPSVEAEVVSVGPHVKELSVGDTVMVDLWQGTQVVYDGISYWIVDEERVSATV